MLTIKIGHYRMTKDYYIGLMSGTSLDAVDAVLVDFNDAPLKLIETHQEPIPGPLRQEILALCYPGDNAIYRMGQTDVKLGRLFADSSLNLLNKTNIPAKEIRAIGSHGQNIRHAPNAEFPFTLQIGDPNIIAANTGITTVADFRRRDMALGGQAAPLAPAFHEYLLRDSTENRWVLNIGGIANLTFLPADKSQAIIGFDTGPGNTLMDAWCRKHHKGNYDKDGEWAASGQCDETLLQNLLKDPYFSKTPPKSTGREYFHLDWLQSSLSKHQTALKPEDVQATLLALTVKSITNAIHAHPITAKQLWICGGGAQNKQIVQKLNDYSENLNLQSTEDTGIHPDWIEATAFAWLARQTINGKCANVPTVTGARTATILGAIYPVSNFFNEKK